MRDIKFKAFIKSLKIIAPVVAIDFYLEILEVDLSEGNEDSIEYDFSDIELMQFTGFKDRNGVEIFEGDIFTLGDLNILYQVVWHNAGFMGKQLKSSSYVGLLHWKNKIEILGNIHENPEMLEYE